MDQEWQLAEYVASSLGLHDILLSPEQRQRVTQTFIATAAVAAPLLAVKLPDGSEPAPVFRA